MVAIWYEVGMLIWTHYVLARFGYSIVFSNFHELYETWKKNNNKDFKKKSHQA